MSRKNRQKPKIKRSTGFVAYPSQDRAQADLLERAVKAVNADPGSRLRLYSWKDIPRKTSRIITNILDAIDKYDCFLADVSGLNPNVLFEVGYALAKGKRLLLMGQGNSDADRRKDLEDCHLLSDLEIVPIRNMDDVLEALRKRFPAGGKPDSDLSAFQLTDSLNRRDGVFLRGSIKADPALAAVREFSGLFPACLEDDWTEDSAKPLDWYLSMIKGAKAVAALLVHESWNDSRRINSRYSMLCGVAVGFAKQLCMIGLSEYEPAFDYRNWFRRAETSSQAVRAIQDAFRACLSSGNGGKRSRSPLGDVTRSGHSRPSSDDKELVLLSIAVEALMQNIAEHEQPELEEYFVRTAKFEEALNGRHQIFIGSKGSGKTANFFQLKTEFLRDRRNIVCDIKPSDYKLGRFLEALGKVTRQYGAYKHVSETAWKLIVLCELLQTLHNTIEGRPTHVPLSQHEEQLLTFYNQHRLIIAVSFERHLEQIAEWLEREGYDEENFTKRSYDSFLSPAARLLEPVLYELDGKIVILVDNLDKAWDRSQDLTLEAAAIYGLLSACPSIEDDFHRKAEIDLVVFLRRNIFEFVVEMGREPDKLLEQAAELVWDRDTLLQVIEERVKAACTWHGIPQFDAWHGLFPELIDGEYTREWIFSRLLHRPRDLIHFVRRAMQAAGDHRHHEVQDDDLRLALKSYSEWAISQVVAEYQAENPWLPNVVASLMGTYEVHDLFDLERHVGRILDEPSCCVRPREAVAKLVQAGVFGVCIGEEIRFAETIQDSLLLRRKVEHNPKREPLFLHVNPAFHAHLGVVKGMHKPRSFWRRIVDQLAMMFG